VDFADEAAYKVYSTHPDHQEVIVKCEQIVSNAG
jgi:hypothetical protein